MADTNAPSALLAMPMPTRASCPEMEMLGPLMRGRNPRAASLFRERRELLFAMVVDEHH